MMTSAPRSRTINVYVNFSFINSNQSTIACLILYFIETTELPLNDVQAPVFVFEKLELHCKHVI